jgi:carotenoid cleavage dioxygenase-like enzyme
MRRRRKSANSGALQAVRATSAGENRSNHIVLDAERIDASPVAIVNLHDRAPFGFHGNWRDALSPRPIGDDGERQ